LLEDKVVNLLVNVLLKLFIHKVQDMTQLTRTKIKYESPISLQVPILFCNLYRTSEWTI